MFGPYGFLTKDEAKLRFEISVHCSRYFKSHDKATIGYALLVFVSDIKKLAKGLIGN